MKKNLLKLFFLTLLLAGCTNAVENVKKQMHTRFELDMTKSLEPIVSTMLFYNYAVPENYWYSENTSYREVIDDEFRQGMRGLEKLDNVIGGINTSNSELTERIENLHDKIKEGEKALKDARQSLRQANSVFGFGMYGGVNTLLDFAELLGGSNGKEEEPVQMPKDVKVAFNGLVRVIENCDYKFFNDLHAFELKAIGNNKLNDEQLLDIRKELKVIVVEQIKQHYTDADTIARNRITKTLLSSYDEAFPVGAKGIEPTMHEDKSATNTSESSVGQSENVTERTAMQADFDAACAKMDQLETANTSTNETLQKDKKQINSLQTEIRNVLSDRNATTTDLSKAKENIAQLIDKIREYEADIASLEMKN